MRFSRFNMGLENVTLGCSDLKLRYLSEWVGLRHTAESKWPLGERLISKSRLGLKTEDILFLFLL